MGLIGAFGAGGVLDTSSQVDRTRLDIERPARESALKVHQHARDDRRREACAVSLPPLADGLHTVELEAELGFVTVPPVLVDTAQQSSPS
jgi:hypothetical protein